MTVVKFCTEKNIQRQIGMKGEEFPFRRENGLNVVRMLVAPFSLCLFFYDCVSCTYTIQQIRYIRDTGTSECCQNTWNLLTKEPALHVVPTIHLLNAPLNVLHNNTNVIYRPIRASAREKKEKKVKKKMSFSGYCFGAKRSACFSTRLGTTAEQDKHFIRRYFVRSISFPLLTDSSLVN